MPPPGRWIVSGRDVDVGFARSALTRSMDIVPQSGWEVLGRGSPPNWVSQQGFTVRSITKQEADRLWYADEKKGGYGDSDSDFDPE